MNNKVILHDAFKRFTLDQDKTLPPEDTVKLFKDKLNKIDLDILKDTVRIDNGRLDIPVFISYYGQDAKNVTVRMLKMLQALKSKWEKERHPSRLKQVL